MAEVQVAQLAAVEELGGDLLDLVAVQVEALEVGVTIETLKLYLL